MGQRCDNPPPAAAILDKFVDRLRGQNLVVSGYADRSGPEAYNFELSRRRAEAVKRYIEQRGLAGRQIEVVAYGETRPLVETADGTAELQNRYVLISLKPD